MSEANTAPSRRSWLRRAGIAVGIVLASLVLALGGVMVWLAVSESALQWGARQAEATSRGALVLDDVRGALRGPLHIGTLRFTTGFRRIEADAVDVDWSPRALLRWHLQIDSVRVGALRVSELQLDPTPPMLPDSLRLPVTVSAPDIRLGRVELERGEKGDPFAAFSDIALGAQRRSDGWTLDVRSLSSAWGQLRAGVALGDVAPFKLQAHGELTHSAGAGRPAEPAYRVEATATGDLKQLLINATARAFGTQARIDAQLAPLDTLPLVSAHISTDSIDPARVRDGLPAADLSAQLAVTRRPDGGYDGNVAVRNANAGRWDAARLPLRELVGSLSGTPDAFDLTGLRIDLGDAGRFEGDGRFRDRRLQLALNTSRFDPHGVHGKMRSIPLAGDIRLSAQADDLGLVADLRSGRFRLHLDADKQGDTVALREIGIAGGSGRLGAKGRLFLGEPGTFDLSGTLAAFNPAEFGDYPAARINASFDTHGQLGSETAAKSEARAASVPQAAVTFAITDSRFRERPLSGQGKLNVSAERVWNVDLNLSLARSQLHASGALGNADDRLDFRLISDDLAVIDPQLGGAGQASGTLEGRYAALSGKANVQAGQLAWGRQYRLASVQANVVMGKGFAGPLHIESTLRGLLAPQLRLDRASLNADGTRDDHSVQIEAKNPSVDLRGRFAGGWKEGGTGAKESTIGGWRGEIRELSNRGTHAFTLQAPATLEIARQQVLLGNARFAFAGGALNVDEFAYAAGRLASRGEFKNLPLAYVKTLTARADDFETDLVLGGDWQFTVADQVDGHVSLRRESGDVAYRSNIDLLQEPRLALGLDRFTFDAEANDSRVHLRAEANGTQLGSLKLDAQSTLTRRDGTWGIAGDAPVQGHAVLAVKTLAWLQPIIESAVSFDGALYAEVRLDGRMAQPMLSGSLSGSRFSVALLDQGVKFTEGRFRAGFRDRVLRLDELSLRGGDGTLTGQGQASLENGSPTMQLALQAKKLDVLAAPDRQLTLSGTTQLSATGKAVHVSAELKADRGSIELPKAETPTLSRDVVVRGRDAPAGIAKPAYSLSYDLDLSLGDRFVVKGKGLDAQLGGSLKLTGAQGAWPNTQGSIRVIKGSYSAYGQRLDIERGFLNFQGPLDNPGLNIVAMRKDQLVEAGVSVTGTVRTPLVTLVSNPAVPDSQKLSWLVLGHGTENASAQEFSALQLAAQALLGAGQSVSLQQRIAGATGLDEVSLKGSGGLENTVLTVGKRLSSRAYVSYEQGLATTSTLVKINYLLSQRLSLRVQAGLSPAVDLFYTFSFD